MPIYATFSIFKGIELFMALVLKRDYLNDQGIIIPPKYRSIYDIEIK